MHLDALAICCQSHGTAHASVCLSAQKNTRFEVPCIPTGPKACTTSGHHPSLTGPTPERQDGSPWQLESHEHPASRYSPFRSMHAASSSCQHECKGLLSSKLAHKATRPILEVTGLD
jgi:hypothetical protein